ncbi:MAG: YggT family protein [Eubacteriales bacterium]
MEQEYKQTETTREVTPAEPVQNAVRTETYQEVTRAEPVKSFPVVKIVYFILGALEIFLGLRLILRLLGASANNMFVPFVYNVTWIFIAPFSGIFSTAVTKGAETQAVLEPATIIAMLIYALLAWGIVKLIIIIRNKKPEGYRNN